ncbi:FAD-dependent monooxygenase [Glycomyces sp. NPDC046736]|uniref:FAD-dependent monooxygenase n=1 Tax=Glycomyces sp. NPDC046736 TaxID=3155615 RepID=UPI0033E70130
MSRPRVLVSGAGIAGTALAYWLHQGGFAPVVVERAAELRPGGYKIDVRGAALQVVERMGLLDAVREARTDIRDAYIVNAKGRRFAALDADAFGGRVHGDAELHRGALAALLYERSEAKYRFGDSIAALDETGEGVEVRFESGGTERFEFVIGADGLHSRTRALAFGPEAEFVRDLGYGVASYSVPNELGLDRCEMTYVGPGRTALVYHTAGSEHATALFLWAAAELEVPRERDARLAVLREAYAGEAWEVPRLLAAAEESPDFYLDTLSQVRMPRWSKGRVALVGDAAHCASATSGQGTSLALVGAYVLAGELARAAEPQEGLAAYERIMRPFAETNQALGPRNVKSMVMRGRAQIAFATGFLAVASRLPGKDRLMAPVVNAVHAAATAIDLPDYGF